MAIRIVNEVPDASVVKQCLCRNCGVKLEYTPADVRKESMYDYTGSSDTYRRIDCPKCQHVINVS